MASPITWRNVDAPDLSGTAQIMGQGNSALTNGLAALQQTAQDIGKTNIDVEEYLTEDKNKIPFLTRSYF